MHRLRDPRWFLILAFLLTIGGVPVVQVMLEARQEEGVRVLEVFNQAPTAANLRGYERNLEAANWAARTTRTWIQVGQFAWLGYGGGKAVLGSNGWYFYKPGLQDMLARPPAPRPHASPARRRAWSGPGPTGRVWVRSSRNPPTSVRRPGSHRDEGSSLVHELQI